MSARQEAVQAFVNGGWSEQIAREIVASVRAEAMAEAKVSAELAEEDYRRMVGAASQLEKQLRARIAELEAAVAQVGTDFYKPGMTYTAVETPDYGWKFRCDVVTTHPEDGERTALGWRFFGGVWDSYSYGEDDWGLYALAEVATESPQPEDPHSSPLHHDYELGRDDLRFNPEKPSGEAL